MTQQRGSDNASENSDTIATAASHSSITGAGGMRIALPIVQVRVKAADGDTCTDTFALLDSGSTGSFCTKDLMHRLGASGKKQTLSISTLENANSTLDSMVISLQVEGKTTDEKVNLPRVYTKSRINVSPEHLAKREDIRKYQHLSDLNIPTIDDVQVDMLKGQDASQALIPLEVRKGNPGEVYTVRTILGWTLNGPLDAGGFQGHVSTNFVSENSTLDEQVKQFGAIESTGSLLSDLKGMSVMDKKVLKL